MDDEDDELANDAVDASMIKLALSHLNDPCIGNKAHYDAIRVKAKRTWRVAMGEEDKKPADTTAMDLEKEQSDDDPSYPWLEENMNEVEKIRPKASTSED
jgi:hypothetical protein